MKKGLDLLTPPTNPEDDFLNVSAPGEFQHVLYQEHFIPAERAAPNILRD